LSSLVDPPLFFAAPCLELRRRFFSYEKGLFFFCDSSFANFAWGIAVGAFSALQTRPHRYRKIGGQEPGVFFPICPSMLLLPGTENFFGFGDGEECASVCSDSSA